MNTPTQSHRIAHLRATRKDLRGKSDQIVKQALNNLANSQGLDALDEAIRDEEKGRKK